MMKHDATHTKLPVQMVSVTYFMIACLVK